MRVGLIIVCFVVFTCSYTEAQTKRKKKNYPAYSAPQRPSENELFLRTQWWLGFKAGANTTTADPDNSFSGFSPLNYEGENKKYDDYGSITGHAGLEITFYHRGFSFSLQPNYRRQSFVYSNSYEWIETSNVANSLILNYEQKHRLDYIEVPLLIKYDLTRTKLRPFLQVGAYYAKLISAEKSIERSGTDFASGNAGPFENQTSIIGVDDLFLSSSVGIAGGLGLSYDVWNVRMILDAIYRHGLNNVVDVENRYSNNQLASIGDTMDDIKLKNISISFGIVFPLRFISSSLNATN